MFFPNVLIPPGTDVYGDLHPQKRRQPHRTVAGPAAAAAVAVVVAAELENNLYKTFKKCFEERL